MVTTGILKNKARATEKEKPNSTAHLSRGRRIRHHDLENVETYPKAVQFLLTTYASAEIIAEDYSDVQSMVQGSEMNEI